MKKLIFILCVAFIAIAFTGCQQRESTEAEVPETESASTANSLNCFIAIIDNSGKYNYFVQFNRTGATREITPTSSFDFSYPAGSDLDSLTVEVTAQDKTAPANTFSVAFFTEYFKLDNADCKNYNKTYIFNAPNSVSPRSDEPDKTPIPIGPPGPGTGG